MTSLYENSAQCCGCSACYAICSTKAISMQSDNEGFIYPNIDQNRCVNCNACKSVCPLKNKNKSETTLDFPKFIAVKHKDEIVKLSSTSGGVFTALSDFILDNGGVVYGVIFDEFLRAVHIRTDNKQQRDKMCISKYVQSDVLDTFRQIKSDLLSSINVLFTGTPCQVAGLKEFLKKDYKNLFTCDVICHGVPSPLMFSEHISHIESVRRKKIVNYNCRSKICGWHKHIECAEFKDGKIEHSTPLVQVHKTLFHAGFINRPACYECRFTNLNRPSDLTMGDFWGIEKVLPEWDDQIGTSIIIINTSRGLNLFNNIEATVDWKYTNTYGRQPRLEKPSPKPINRKEFWNDYTNYGYVYIASKYGKNSFKDWLKYFAKIILRK